MKKEELIEKLTMIDAARNGTRKNYASEVQLILLALELFEKGLRYEDCREVAEKKDA